MAYERTDRAFNEYRNLKMTVGFISSADGSVLIEMGRTRTASIIGGFVALAIALKKIKARLGLTEQILQHGITAILRNP